jgi:hypothetical protein
MRSIAISDMCLVERTVRVTSIKGNIFTRRGWIDPTIERLPFGVRLARLLRIISLCHARLRPWNFKLAGI